MSQLSQTVDLELPEKLVDVFTGPARYRGSYGGRGSGKTRSFAKMSAVWGVNLAQQGKEGIILCGREYMNSLDESSMAEIKAAIASEPWLAERYDVGEKYIRTIDKRIEYKFAGLSRNIDSIKSKSQIHLFWVDEAEPVTETAWQKVIPTVREHGSEIWVTWNPERKTSNTHMRFREQLADDMKIAEMNWRDNPWFPEVLDRERRMDLALRPEQYDHIWEGDFKSVVEGAYFAKHMLAAKQENRIGVVGEDPLMAKYAIWDIGGTGAKADATAIWVVQFIGSEVRILNYYEAQGQPLAAHIEWLRTNNYGSAECILPHDGATNDKVYSVSFESALQSAGFSTTVVPNQGKGAASARIEAARRMFPGVTFNKSTTEPGREALGWYHEKRDEDRNVGLGPEHDWSSHGADAFGLIAVFKEGIPKATPKALPYRSRKFA